MYQDFSSESKVKNIIKRVPKGDHKFIKKTESIEKREKKVKKSKKEKK